MSNIGDSLARTQGTDPQGDESVATPTAASGQSIYPPGATNANWFGLFNAVSWQITLGSPLILYAKSQGASATLLGVLASLTPLLVIFQIPAAHYLPKYGYRRFIMAGWGSRTICVFALAVIPLLAFAPPSLKLAMVVLSMFIFNLLRGMASGAWLPWITELIPEQSRGRFLSRDQLFGQIGGLAALSVAALVLQGNPQPWQFSVVFLISACGGTISLLFLQRVPDVTAPEKLRKSGLRVPWMAMLTYPPFFRLMLYDLLCYSITGGLAVFPVAFLKGVAGYSESCILWISSLSILSALLTVHWVGHILDRNGSKGVLRFCMALFVLIVLGWWLVAARLLSQSVAMAAVLFFLYGIAYTNFTVANNRLMMATMPLMGRNHFFALFTVITNVGLGIAPIAWGLLLDAIGRQEHSLGVISWNRYSIYFAMVLALTAAAVIFVSFLHETQQGVVRKPAAKAPVSTPCPTASSAW